MTEFRRYWALEFQGGGGPATRLVSQHIGACIAWLGERAALSPNHLTIFSLCSSVSAALLYTTLSSGWVGILPCLFLFQLAYGFDCADGQLARATGQTSEFGSWLDVAVDTVSVLALSFAMLFWLSIHFDSGPNAFICITILTVGRVLALHASTAARSSEYARKNQNRPFTMGDVPKKILWFIFDTPVILAVVCLLRDSPQALQIYALLIGGIETALAIYLGLRLERA